MPTPNPQNQRDKALFSVLLETFYKLLPFVPVKWRPAVAAFLTFLAVLLGIVYAEQQVNQPTEPSRPVSMVTIDGRDVDGRVKGGVLSVACTASNQARCVAPLMDWENKDVREGRVLSWCMAEANDAPAEDIVRGLLNELSARFPANVRWTEQCPGQYTFAGTAGADCGSPDALACAVYLGERAGRVSFNGQLRAGFLSPGLSDRGMKIAMAHEIQHLLLNLDHTQCDNPEPSAMSPIYLPDGPSCARATGLEPYDWAKAIEYYALQGGNQPTPTPTPSPTPVPDNRRRLYVRVWNEGCGGWCVQTVDLGDVAASGTWVELYDEKLGQGTQHGFVGFTP